MGKGGGKSVGKALFTIGGFFLGGGFWTGLHAANWLSGAVLGASLGSSIWSATHKPKQAIQTHLIFNVSIRYKKLCLAQQQFLSFMDIEK